jgi:hypothetical protein
VKEVSDRHIEERVDFSLLIADHRGICDFWLYVRCKKFCKAVKYIPLKFNTIFTCTVYNLLLVDKLQKKLNTLFFSQKF